MGDMRQRAIGVEAGNARDEDDIAGARRKRQRRGLMPGGGGRWGRGRKWRPHQAIRSLADEKIQVTIVFDNGGIVMVRG